MGYTSRLQYRRKLKRSENCSAAIRRMHQLNEMCDVEFVVDKKTFPANRTWCSAASPVIHKLLSNGMKESGLREVAISEVSSDTWGRAIDYVYYENIDITCLDDAISLLECA